MRGAHYLATFLTKQICKSSQPARLEQVLLECKPKVRSCQPEDSLNTFCRRQLHTHSTNGTPAGALPAVARNFQQCLSRTAPAKGVRQYNNYSWNTRRQWLPHIPADTALYGLIAANLAGFFLWRADTRFMMRHFTTSWDGIKQGRMHTLVTSAFSQRDLWHLLANMVGLYFFGRSVAWQMGGRGLILLYLAGGTLGNVVHVAGQALQEQRLARSSNPWLSSNLVGYHTPALGSSGAVNAIVIFDILMNPTVTVLIYGIVPVQAWILGGLWLFQDISGALGHGMSNIGYTAHLGGAAVGALAFLAVRRGRLPRRWL